MSTPRTAATVNDSTAAGLASRATRPRRRNLVVLAFALLVIACLVGGLLVRRGDASDPEVAASGEPPAAAPDGRPRVAPSSGSPDRVDPALGTAVAARVAETLSLLGNPVDPVDVVSVPAASGGAAVPAGPGTAPSAPAGPLLLAPAHVFGDPGEAEAEFVLTNSGGSPLHWSIPNEDHPTPVAQPNAGTLAPGAQVMVYFELPHMVQQDSIWSLQVLSDGGDANIAVHLDALEPVFEITSGTWNIRNGNTFLASYGDMDMGLKLRNIGDQPLAVSPLHFSGLTVIGGPWVLQPGEQVHLQVILCNAAFSGGIPDFHDRDLHIQTDGWQGTIDFGLRFTLAPGQVAPAC